MHNFGRVRAHTVVAYRQEALPVSCLRALSTSLLLRIEHGAGAPYSTRALYGETTYFA